MNQGRQIRIIERFSVSKLVSLFRASLEAQIRRLEFERQCKAAVDCWLLLAVEVWGEQVEGAEEGVEDRAVEVAVE